MTLAQLGREYIAESTELIKLRDELILRLSFCHGEQRAFLKKRIANLNEMADDCRKTGEKLVTYYSNSSYLPQENMCFGI